MQAHFQIAAIGELLWDLLPDGPQLGGAPANYAAMSANLSTAASAKQPDAVYLISRVGDDPPGRQALGELGARGVRLDHVSVDPTHATGSVTVTFHPDRGPGYRIEENVAWDFIPETQQLAVLAPTLDAICFGTLAQRSPSTRETLRRTVEATRADCARIFDVNLRAPYWTPEILEWGCSHATILKMNAEEVTYLARMLGSPAQQESPLDLARFLLREFPVQLVAVTRGANGSLLVTREDVQDHPGVPGEVVDTIGAGDAFTAALTYAALHRLPLPAMAEAANRLGAWVAAHRGGMPELDGSAQRRWKRAIQTTGNG